MSATAQELLPFTAHRIELAPGEWTMPEGGDVAELNLRTRICLERFGGTLEGKRAVDLGCLEGGYATAFARAGAAESLGIEARELNVARCELVRERLGLANLRFERADVRTLSRDRHGAFDLVFCAGLLYHLDDPVSFIGQMAEVCDDLLVIDTHVAEAGGHHRAGPLASRMLDGEEWQGHELAEWDEDAEPERIEELAWASYGNRTSFWLSQDSLIRALHRSGFEYVTKVIVPRPWHCPLGCLTECRVLLVAGKSWP